MPLVPASGIAMSRRAVSKVLRPPAAIWRSTLEELARASKTMGRSVGLEISRARPSNAPWRRARVLEATRSSLVIDVGANHGRFGLELRNETGYRGRLISVEPGAEAYRALERVADDDPLWLVRRMALSDYSGTATLSVPLAESALSSLLPAARGLAREAERGGVVNEVVPVQRLDEIGHEFIHPLERAYLKIDAQGSEAAIIRGTIGVLHCIVALECELALVPMYEGQPSFRDMIDLIDAHGFDPVGLQPNFVDPGTGYMYDADVVFVRRGIS